jgi:hypothetical protein
MLGKIKTGPEYEAEYQEEQGVVWFTERHRS